jgi:hypothetical protein
MQQANCEASSNGDQPSTLQAAAAETVLTFVVVALAALRGCCGRLALVPPVLLVLCRQTRRSSSRAGTSGAAIGPCSSTAAAPDALMRAGHASLTPACTRIAQHPPPVPTHSQPTHPPPPHHHPLPPRPPPPPSCWPQTRRTSLGPGTAGRSRSGSRQRRTPGPGLQAEGRQRGLGRGLAR